MKKDKKLRRSSNNRIIAGVLGGISEYFGWNAIIVRILYVVLSFVPYMGWVTVLGYIVMITIIPSDHSGSSMFNNFKESANPDANNSRKVIHDVEEKDVHDTKGDKN